MRALALYLSALALVGLTSVAQAQYVRLSWDGCNPQVPNKDFAGPGIYKLVVSATGLTGAVAGYDCAIDIGPDIQDAWRFDVGGCQGGAVTMATSAASKTCPSLCGANPLPITLYGYDPATQTATVRLAVAFDSVAANPATRYTLWQVSFDHTYSVAGADSDSVTCDNAGPPYGYYFTVSAEVLRQEGSTLQLAATPGDSQVSWNGGPSSGDRSDSTGSVAVITEVTPSIVRQNEDVQFLIVGRNLPKDPLVRLVDATGVVRAEARGVSMGPDALRAVLHTPGDFVGKCTIFLIAQSGVATSFADGVDVLPGVVPPPARLEGSWTPDGVPVAVAPENQDRVRSVADGDGGVIFCWQDRRTSGTTGIDVYAQRMTALGAIQPGWSANGVALCTAIGDQEVPQLCSDMAGGALVTWQDRRGANTDVYVQHIGADGSLYPGWPVNGLAICSASDQQRLPQLVPDGTGGAIVAWEDRRAGNADIYGLRILGNGTIAAGWPVNGRALCTTPAEQQSPTIAADASGGAIVAWMDFRNQATSNCDIYCQRVGSDGSIIWTMDGVSATQATGADFYPKAVSDGESGVVIAWYKNSNIYAQRITATGSSEPGWPANGQWLGGGWAYEGPPVLTYDGTGGAIVAWHEVKSSSLDEDVYAQHIAGSGSIWPLWPARGFPISTFIDSGANFPGIVSDDAGGAVIAWTDARNGTGDIYALRVRGTGEIPPGWAANGIAICTAASHQVGPTIAPDGSGGGVIGWCDSRSMVDADVYAQRVTGDGVVGPTVGVAGAVGGEALRLQVAPTPALAGNRVRIEVRGADNALISLVNCAGRKVKSWTARGLGASQPAVVFWDGKGDSGQQAPAGVYLVVAEADGAQVVRRVVWLGGRSGSLLR